jgi:hypothetical protein
MSEYKGIKGFQVTTRTEDPVPFAQAIENNPYAGAWSSGGNLNSDKSMHAMGGTYTAAFSAGGSNPSVTANHEQYNGTSWTEVADLNLARNQLAGTGTTPASLVFGGSVHPSNKNETEVWNGSAWTEVNNLNTARRLLNGGGTSTATLGFGGYTTTYVANTESWDGTSWTEVNDLNTARQGLGAAGISTAALGFGGAASPGNVGNTESWNGSTWTEVNDLGTGRRYAGSAGSVYTAALFFGGEDPPKSAKTESWDGSSWTEVADLATARTGMAGGGAGTFTQALASGGELVPGNTNATEEWTFSGIQPTDPAAGYANAITGDFYYNSTTGQFKTVNDGGVPIGTWASGGTLPRETYASAASGTVSATLLWGGYDDSGYFDDSLEFDGTSWGSPVNMNVPGTSNRYGVGTQTATLAISGYNTSPAPGVGMPQVESYNGSAWSEIADVSTGVSGHGVAGNTSNAIKYGGTTAMVSPSHPTKSYEAKTEQYNGSSWTEVGDLNTAREGITFANQMPYTAGVAVGGANAPGAVLAIHETWNGSAWTETTDLNEGMSNGGGASDGTQTSIIIFGGNDPSPGYLATNEFWNGTSWTEVNDLSAGRYGMGAAGASSSNAMAIGNYPSQSNANTWEHFVAADFEIKTVTTS